MMVPSRSGARAAGRALFALLLLFGEAEADGAENPASFAIVSQAPLLEVRFHGIALRGARGEPNQIALDFAQPVDPTLFDRLQHAVPGWIDMAYGGYDNAVISATRPVEFLTRKENDGFSLRLVAAKQGDTPPSGPTDDAGTTSLPDGVQTIDTPFGAQGTDTAPRAPLSKRISHFLEGLF